MFGTLTKLADKAFIVGFYLPALLFTVCFALTAPPDSAIFDVAKEMLDSEKLAGITLVALGIWLFAVLMMAGNYWMYRALEGYWGPLKLKWLRNRVVKARESEAKKVNELKIAKNVAALNAKGKPLNSPEVIVAHKIHYNFLTAFTRFRKRYPRDVANILPTKFGNVIVAFESYPAVVYRVESISIWPRLQAVIPKEFLENLAETKSLVDFYVNVVYLAGILVAWCVIQLGVAAAFGAFRYQVIGPLLLATVVARASYALAVSSAMSWGDVVKAAFDLYLPALAKQLGYEYPPTGKGRAKFWDKVGNQFRFHDAVIPEQFVPLSSKEMANEQARGAEGENPEATEEPEAETRMTGSETGTKPINPQTPEDPNRTIAGAPQKTMEI